MPPTPFPFSPAFRLACGLWLGLTALPAEAAVCRSRDFTCELPGPWTLQRLPPLGHAPRQLQRWEFSRTLHGRRLRIDLELDRSERLGKYPVRDARGAATRLATALRFDEYAWGELKVKGAPGFYESWRAQLPGKPRFRVWAAHFFHAGARVRAGAVADAGEPAALAERDLQSLLRSWTWLR